MGQLCQIDMDGATSSIRKVRSFVDVTLTAWQLDALRERAVLLTSELATNAVLHARTRFQVAVLLDRELVVQVTDGSREMPVVEATPLDGDRGRGLRLVSELASRWGSRVDDDGKTVWFTLALASPPEGGVSGPDAQAGGPADTPVDAPADAPADVPS